MFLCSHLMVCVGVGVGVSDVCVAVTGLFLLPSPLLAFFCKRAGLGEGVTDEGLRALASAGCGENLTKLDLSCECSCVLVLI